MYFVSFIPCVRLTRNPASPSVFTSDMSLWQSIRLGRAPRRAARPGGLGFSQSSQRGMVRDRCEDSDSTAPVCGKPRLQPSITEVTIQSVTGPATRPHHHPGPGRVGYTQHHPTYLQRMVCEGEKWLRFGEKWLQKPL